MDETKALGQRKVEGAKKKSVRSVVRIFTKPSRYDREPTSGP
jgi:hypothetical protein